MMIGSDQGQSQQGMENYTEQLCAWINRVRLADIPEKTQTRVKYLILDALACGYVGAGTPWAKVAAEGVSAIEDSGSCRVLRWQTTATPLTAALLNSTFIQGLEIDDYHPLAPIHSGAIVVPVLLALVEHISRHGSQYGSPPVTGNTLLLAATIGYELGPRIGLALHGLHILEKGWHSGAVFGPVAAAATASKVLSLPADKIEDAIGTACTQAGGLMSAQYESMVKRMQHGFAARNGLFAALMAAKGYTGIKKVLERPYGGFLANFSQGNGRDPQYRPELVTARLGQQWEIDEIVVKPYASMASTHVAIDCVKTLQEEQGKLRGSANLSEIKKIVIEMAEAAFKKSGWKASKPITITGAQMNAQFAAALQLLDGKVEIAQFLDETQINRPELWALIEKIECQHNPEFDAAQKPWRHHLSVEFANETMETTLDAPRSRTKPLSNDEILQKWRTTTEGILHENERRNIESKILGLEQELDVVTVISTILQAGTRIGKVGVCDGAKI